MTFGKSKRKKRAGGGSSGGKAEASGSNYETLVGAWYCYTLLLGNRIQPLFDLPSGIEVISLLCQTDALVDDVNAYTSEGGLIFVQAKRSVSLSEAKTSAFASAVDQFVRQFKACADASFGKTWARPLSSKTDRLVLATRGLSSSKIVEILPRLLDGLREQASANSLADVAISDSERSVAKTVEKCLKRSWRDAYERLPLPRHIR